MDHAQKNFHKRGQALQRKHMRMAQGYVTRMNRNGVMQQVPDSKAGGFTARAALRLILAVLIFKVVAFISLGEVSYVAKVEALSQGAIYEKVGAWAMQADLLTRFMAEQITLFMQ